MCSSHKVTFTVHWGSKVIIQYIPVMFIINLVISPTP